MTHRYAISSAIDAWCPELRHHILNRFICRYFVTWKADGTRYLLLLMQWGVYLIDRSFNVQRVQMRFPLRGSTNTKHGSAQRLHNMTLLDGEMVVDSNLVDGTSIRRFLAYDLMMLNGVSVVQQPFKVRTAAGIHSPRTYYTISANS